VRQSCEHCQFHQFSALAMDGSRFDKGRKVGSGTFGDISKATDRHTDEQVALKKVKVDGNSDGVNVTALREMKALKEIVHPNVARLVAVYAHKRTLVLALEYLPSDLEAVIKDSSSPLPPERIKSFMMMALRALECIHSRFLAHRDIKPNNFLLASDGTLKLADFGLSRPLASPDVRMTSQVHMRWYRAPELLLGARHYSTSVDMWAFGCIFAEMLQRRPWIVGNSDIEQLQLIFERRGSPDAVGWHAAKLLPTFVEPKRSEPKPLKHMLPHAPNHALSLLDRLVQLNPLKRLTASQCLQSDFMCSEPAPEDKSTLPVPSVSAAARVTAERERNVEDEASGKEDGERNVDGHVDGMGEQKTERSRKRKKRKRRKEEDNEGNRDMDTGKPANEEGGEQQQQQQEEEDDQSELPQMKALRNASDETPADTTRAGSAIGAGELGTMPHTGTVGTAGTTGQEKLASESSPPGLSTVDRQYLRRRAQDLDEAMGLLSQPREDSGAEENEEVDASETARV